MQPRKKDGKVELICRNCGRTEKMEKNNNFKISEKIEHDAVKDDIPVIDSKNKVKLPTTKIECPKCGNDEAEWWTRQTRSSDEPETRFYRCTKCGYTWREYS